MNSTEVISALLCIISFFVYFIALYLDLIDVESGSPVRRLQLFLCIVFSAALIIRLGQQQLHGLIWLWFIIAIFRTIGKWLQFKGMHHKVNEKLRNVMTTRSERKPHATIN